MPRTHEPTTIEDPCCECGFLNLFLSPVTVKSFKVWLEINGSNYNHK